MRQLWARLVHTLRWHTDIGYRYAYVMGGLHREWAEEERAEAEYWARRGQAR